MRELKFRAWFENVKRGREINGELVWGIESYYDYDPIIDNGGLLEVEGGWDICGNSDENYTIEQYTGLKDKNGKEIYEGDIVDYNDDGECIGVVEYDAPEFYLNADATNWARMFLKGAPHQRVIGNIHENPELLEGEK